MIGNMFPSVTVYVIRLSGYDATNVFTYDRL